MASKWPKFMELELSIFNGPEVITFKCIKAPTEAEYITDDGQVIPVYMDADNRISIDE